MTRIASLCLIGSALTACLVSASCGDGGESFGSLIAGSLNQNGTGSHDPCALANDGCPCDPVGEVVGCGNVDRRSGDYLACSPGTRTCTAAGWGPCTGDAVAPKKHHPAYEPQGLGTPNACLDNPCDPACMRYLDTPDGLDAGADSDIEATDAGLTLFPHAVKLVQNGAACTGITVAPSPQSVVITSVTPLVTSPVTLGFGAFLTPFGCAANDPTSQASAAWSLDQVDLASIGNTGLFQLYSPVAGPIQVYAYSGAWQATGNVNVTLKIVDPSKAPAGTAASFTGAGTGPDPMVVRYPYDGTVFPRGLKAPVVQWQTGGTAAQAVKISLRFPASGTAIFDWSMIIPEPASPQAVIPQAVWAAFDRTAQGQTGVYVVQRLLGGALKAEVPRKLTFSTAPLKGTIYYTEYASGNLGSWAYERSIDPNNPSAVPVNVYQASGLTETASNKCPVCHSVSANGQTFITSNQAWSSNGGASAISAQGAFSLLGDISIAPNQGTDWRGLSWGAVTPDGKYALSGSSTWGNSSASPPAESGGNGVGLHGDYFTNTTLTGTPALSRTDAIVDFPWAAAAPAGGFSVTSFSVRWTGQIQPLRTDLYTFQTDVDGGVRLYVNGVKIIDQWTDVVQVTTAQVSLVAGQKVNITLEYFNSAGTAQAILRWGSPSTPLAGLSKVAYGSWYLDVLPQNQMYLPQGTLPANGLTASYFPTTTLSGAATTQVDPSIAFKWLGAVPATGIPATSFSARWTGQVLAATTGTYTFQTVARDGVRLWINKILVLNKWANVAAVTTTSAAAVTLTAGQRYDLKLDYYGTTGTTLQAVLNWQVPGSAVFTPVPTASLFPTGDNGGPDYTYDGTMASGKSFVMWQLHDAAGNPQAPAQVGYPPTGLTGATMLVPSFSPDGKRLVFIDGDTVGGAGWRKGLSTFDFNESTQTFSNRKQLRNTWPLGAVMKWPTFEPDSRSVIFDNSTPGDYCNCTTQYGHMAPTNYHGVPGDLWSIDALATTPAAVALARLNAGERPEDADKSYQPTVLPTSVGGYRWAVFTSTRPYGNLLNLAGTLAQNYSSQVWIAAIDDQPSGATDRSHPAFWMPNQNIQLTSAGEKYTNERGFWSLAACVPPYAAGQTPGASNLCQETADCCGGLATTPTAACRIDVPVGSPPVRHCASVGGSSCVPDGGSCNAASDCCSFPVGVCANSVCKLPPPPNGVEYHPASFLRDYQGACSPELTPIWRFFDWMTQTPGNSSITLTAQTADTQAGLATAPVVPFAAVTGAPVTNWTGADVGAALGADASRSWLRVTITLTPSSDLKSEPVLDDWRQSYSCLPGN